MGFSWTTFYFFEGGLLTVDLGRRTFRFVGFDAGRPLVRDTPFWGIRSNVQFNGCTHWADWSIRQEGSTPVVLVRKTQSFRPENYSDIWNS